jgi:hypothetical protein
LIEKESFDMDHTFYALRHRATGHFMPEIGGRGYSNWSPTPEDPAGGLDVKAPFVPRIFATDRGAYNARSQWARGVIERTVYRSGDILGNVDDYDRLEPRDVGRNLDDLQVVPMVLTPADKAVLHLKFSQQDCQRWMKEAFERTLAEYQKDAVLGSFYGPLLKKYMKHVLECEGTTFVGEDNTRHSDVAFTEEESQTLEGLRNEVIAENR